MRPTALLYHNSLTLSQTTILEKYEPFMKTVEEAVTNSTQLTHLKDNQNLHLFSFPITLGIQNDEWKKHFCFDSPDKPRRR